jgi:hypothetical protein
MMALVLLAPSVIMVLSANSSVAANGLVDNDAPSGPWDQTVWTRYRDLDDTENELRVLSGSYPDICRLYNLSAMFPYPAGSPRYSVHNRTIWGLKISDAPDQNETDEPEVFYCALTHAREWISNEVLMYFINYVLRNYAYNSSISSMVNSTQLWFIPIVNPDGFKESIDRDDFNNSYGYYGWRKNTNETNGSPGFQNYGSAQGDGTDLNRNFGHKWGYPGSSTNPNYPTYRGSSAFSEPETQMIRELFKARDFRMALSLHSFSGLNLYPWGYTTDPAVDTPLLSRIAQGMTQYNGYAPIPSSSLYATSGDFVDYVYGTYRIPAFTVEINHRNSRFIPELSRVSEDCHLNREVCTLMADLSHDPYSVFGSGINGTVRDIMGRPVPEASINIKGMSRDLNITTLLNGTFRVSLEPGTYNLSMVKGHLLNSTVSVVDPDVYSDETYIMRDNVPPEVENVTLLVGGVPTTMVEWGANATIRVKERYNETNLTGTLEVYDPGWTGPLALLDLRPNGTHYEAFWETFSFEPQRVYALEAKLKDASDNWDMDGSDPHTLDLFVQLNDTLPPSIYDIGLEGTKNDDGSFEQGKDIDLSVNITGGATWETGIEVNASIIGPAGASSIIDLEWLPVTDSYQAAIPTSGLPLGNYSLTVLASDRFGNGMNATPLGFELADTTGPTFIMYLGNYQTGAYKSGTMMEFVIKPLVMEPHLNASVRVLGPELDLDLTGAIPDPVNDTFVLRWDSYNVPTGTYHTEGRLRDALGNFLPDGTQEGYDLSFNMLDLTPPEVLSMVVNGIEITVPLTINSTNNASIFVRPLVFEEGMGCAVEWVVVGKSIGGTTNLTLEEDRFFGTLASNDMEGYGQYYLEVRLTDRFGNMDPDGLLPDHDLKLRLERPEPFFLSTSAYNRDHEEVWSQNVTEWVLEGETVEISCELGNLTDGDHLELFFNSQSRTVAHIIDPMNMTSKAVFLWNTTGRVGEFNITWKAVPDSSDLVIGPTYQAVIVPRERDHVKDARIRGYHVDGEDGLIVNVSWTPPVGAASLKVAAMINGSQYRIYELALDQDNGSFSVPWADVEFIITVVFDLFPDGSDRTEMAEIAILEEGVSKVTFRAPERPTPPVDDTDDDDDPMDLILPAALITAFVLLVLMVLMLLFLSRRNRTLPVEVWEE